MKSETNTSEAAAKMRFMDRHDRVNDRNLLGFFIIYALFTSGLILSTVIASKIVAFGPFVAPASVFIWALTYPASDIVAEVYGRRYANKMVLGGFIAYLAMFAVLYTAILMPPAPFWQQQEAFASVLGSSFRVMLGAITSYLVTQFLDVFLFSYLRYRTKAKHLWLRNNLSTLVSQTTGNTLFLSIAFLGVFPFDKWLHLFVTNLLMRYALAISDTVIVYTAVGVLYRRYPELKA